MDSIEHTIAPLFGSRPQSSTGDLKFGYRIRRIRSVAASRRTRLIRKGSRRTSMRQPKKASYSVGRSVVRSSFAPSSASKDPLRKPGYATTANCGRNPDGVLASGVDQIQANLPGKCDPFTRWRPGRRWRVFRFIGQALEVAAVWPNCPNIPRNAVSLRDLV